MNYLISIPCGGYKCCTGFGIGIEIKKMIEKMNNWNSTINNISYAGVSSGAFIAFILCHNSSIKYKRTMLNKMINLETSNTTKFTQLDKIRELIQKMLLINDNDYLQFNNKLHIGLIYNFKFTIINNFSSNTNLIDILIASITLFPITYDLFQWIHICNSPNDKMDSVFGIAFDGGYYRKRVFIDAIGAKGSYIIYTFDYDEIGITDKYFLLNKDNKTHEQLILFGQQYVKNNYKLIKSTLKNYTYNHKYYKKYDYSRW
jgi:hypothetical protein